MLRKYLKALVLLVIASCAVSPTSAATGGIQTIHSVATLGGFTAGFMATQGQFLLTGFHTFSNEGFGIFTWYPAASAGAVGTASISGNTLTFATVTSGKVALGQKVTGTGVTAGTIIIGPVSGAGGTGSYLVNMAQSVALRAMTTALVPNGGTIIAPSGVSTCLTGCMVKDSVGHPSLMDFGLSQLNSAAANVTAMNLAIAQGICGELKADAYWYHFNAEIDWPDCMYPVGQGTLATTFINDGTGDGFHFIGASNTVGSRPHGFRMAPTYVTTLGNGGTQIKAILFDQSDSLYDILVQPLSATPSGGVGVECSGCAHSSMHDVTVSTINGKGVYFTSSGPESANGLFGYDINAFNNQDCGIDFNSESSTNVQLSGSSEQNGGAISGVANNGPQVCVQRGFNLVFNYHFEGVPDTTTGTAAIIIGNLTGGIPLNVEVNASTTDAAPHTGVTVVKALTGSNVHLNVTSASGVGYDPTDVFYNIAAAVTSSTAFNLSPSIVAVNASPTSRIIYPANYQTGINVKGNGTPQSVTPASETAVTFATEVSDPTSSWVTNTFTPPDYGVYQITGVIQLTHNDATVASNQLNIDVYDSGTAAILGIPVVVKGYISGSAVNYSYTTPVLAKTDTLQVRVLYAAGSGSPTVALTGTAGLNQMQIIRLQ
jgi:hypothetical protein